MITLTTLDRNEATRSVSNARVRGRRCAEYLEISGISKTNIKQLPSNIQKQVDEMSGTGKITIIVRQQ